MSHNLPLINRDLEDTSYKLAYFKSTVALVKSKSFTRPHIFAGMTKKLVPMEYSMLSEINISIWEDLCKKWKFICMFKLTGSGLVLQCASKHYAINKASLKIQ